MSIKKTLLIMAVAICLLIAGHKIYDVYQEHQPPYAVGQCFVIVDPSIGPIEFLVVENDKVKKLTTAVATVEVIPGATLKVPLQASFDEIRQTPSAEVECSQ